jgi:selenocysteine lyase/cysteine desulfurase
MARAAGAFTVLDAVHYAAHGPIDMKELDSDFLLCSAYKFFGPHIGILYAKKEVQQKLTPLNLRTQSQYPPYMFETGTLHHEGIAGAAAAVKFIADAGVRFWSEYHAGADVSKESRRNQIVAGLSVFDDYEQELCRYFIDALTGGVDGVTVYGPPKGHPRTSTVSFTHEGFHADQVAKYLGEKGIFVWAGHFYAARLVERLGLNDTGGLVRVGIAPYNTKEELDRLLDALKDRKSLADFVESTSSP